MARGAMSGGVLCAGHVLLVRECGGRLLYPNPFHFVYRDGFRAAIVEPSGFRIVVSGHLLRLLEFGVGVLQIGGDAGCSKGVAGDRGVDAGSSCPAADHVPGLGSIEASPGEAAAIAGHGLKEGSLGVRAEGGEGHVGDEVRIEAVMTGHEVAFPSLLGQPDVEAVLFAE